MFRNYYLNTFCEFEIFTNIIYYGILTLIIFFSLIVHTFHHNKKVIKKVKKYEHHITNILPKTIVTNL